MERSHVYTLIAPDADLAQGLLTRLRPSIPDPPREILLGDALAPRSISEATGVLLLAPHAWTDLAAWLPALPHVRDKRPLLLYGSLLLAGLFARPLQGHVCSVLPRSAEPAKLARDLQSLSAGLPRAEATPRHLRTLFELVGRRAGKPDLRLTPRQFENGCAVALGLTYPEMTELFGVATRTLTQQVYQHHKDLDLPDRPALGEFFKQLAAEATRRI